jgi:hypothetical protein
MASGMVSFRRPGQVTAGGFSSEELACLVNVGAAQGLGVMAHANGEQAIIAAASAGVRSIEHGFFMTERALDLMAAKGIFWVPTMVALRRAAGSSAVPDTAQFAEQLILLQQSMLRYAHSIGVPLAIGTDCVLPDPAYRAAYDAEINLFEQAGLAHDAVMRIASRAVRSCWECNKQGPGSGGQGTGRHTGHIGCFITLNPVPWLLDPIFNIRRQSCVSEFYQAGATRPALMQ